MRNASSTGFSFSPPSSCSDFSSSLILPGTIRSPANVARRFPHRLHHLLDLARARVRRLVSLGRFDSRCSRVSDRRDLRIPRRGGINHLRNLVLAENETAPHHHMKARIVLAIALFLGTPVGHALACSQCFTAP